MVSMPQEQQSILNFTVGCLNMVTLYMLWRAHFFIELNACFKIYQILIFKKLNAQ